MGGQLHPAALGAQHGAVRCSSPPASPRWHRAAPSAPSSPGDWNSPSQLRFTLQISAGGSRNVSCPLGHQRKNRSVGSRRDANRQEPVWKRLAAHELRSLRSPQSRPADPPERQRGLISMEMALIQAGDPAAGGASAVRAEPGCLSTPVLRPCRCRDGARGPRALPGSLSPGQTRRAQAEPRVQLGEDDPHFHFHFITTDQPLALLYVPSWGKIEH